MYINKGDFNQNEKNVLYQTQGGQQLMFDIVFQMQEVGGTQGGPQRPFSVLDRLLLTHPVWLQLSLNKDSAVYILLREPVGVCTNAQNITT